jgi:hypothetical protein
VAARFDHRAVLHYKDVVGVRDRSETMRDDQCRSSLAQFRYRILQVSLRFWIKRCGRLVK